MMAAFNWLFRFIIIGFQVQASSQFNRDNSFEHNDSWRPLTSKLNNLNNQYLIFH